MIKNVLIKSITFSVLFALMVCLTTGCETDGKHHTHKVHKVHVYKHKGTDDADDFMLYVLISTDVEQTTTYYYATSETPVTNMKTVNWSSAINKLPFDLDEFDVEKIVELALSNLPEEMQTDITEDDASVATSGTTVANEEASTDEADASSDSGSGGDSDGGGDGD